MERTLSIGEIVAADFRAASVFREAGIDFCCGGKKSIAEACAEKNIDAEKVMENLNNLEKYAGGQYHNFIDWEPGFLCDYIINVHHKYILKALPELGEYTRKIASVHGENHPELVEIALLFSQLSNELLQHLKAEEEILFPAIKKYMISGSESVRQIIAEQIDKLSTEHESAGGSMDKINLISGNYKVPRDACNTYNIAYRLLREFEDDLHVHVHLENNILFRKISETLKIESL